MSWHARWTRHVLSTWHHVASSHAYMLQRLLIPRFGTDRCFFLNLCHVAPCVAANPQLKHDFGEKWQEFGLVCSVYMSFAVTHSIWIRTVSRFPC